MHLPEPVGTRAELQRPADRRPAGDGDARRPCPSPTGYRDEHEVYHPGPGSQGYRQHVVDCAACTASVGRAIDRGDRWARELFPAWSAVIAMPIPGPGMPREALTIWARAGQSVRPRRRQPLRLRPQHVLPLAVVVGVLAYQATSLFGAWLAAGPLLLALVLLERWRGIEIDRVPPARQLRR